MIADHDPTAQSSATPLLTIVVPTHNVSQYVEKCLASLLHGPGDPIEVIVVDDGSTDGTRDMVRRIEQHDSRVSVLLHDQPLGPGMARNAGMAAASGEFLWFVDGDDWLFDGAVARVCEHLIGDIDLLFVDYARVYEDGRVEASWSGDLFGRFPPTPFKLVDWLPVVDVIHVPWNKVVRRALLNAADIVFPTGLYEDVVFTYRVLLAAEAIAVEPSVCYAYRSQRPGALTDTAGVQHLAWVDQWRLVFKAAEQEPPAIQVALFERMIGSGWAVLAHPTRLQGPLRHEFFRRFVALYRELRTSPSSTDVVLASGSWTLAQLRLLPRRMKLASKTSLLRKRTGPLRSAALSDRAA